MPGPLSTPGAVKRPSVAEQMKRVADLMKGKLPRSGKTAKVHGH
jgi:hypothetical protein